MIEITIEDSISPGLNTLVNRLQDKTPMNRMMGAEVANSIRDHMIRLAATRHRTAQRLGASPSGFLGAAAESVEKVQMTADAEGVTLRLSHPAFARAERDVTIVPKSGVYLTIPLIAAAYNQRAYRVPNLFFWRNPKTGKSFLAESISASGVKGTLKLWYLLLQVVTQRRDPTLIPSAAQLTAAAVRGARLYFERLLSQVRAQSQGGAS